MGYPPTQLNNPVSQPLPFQQSGNHSKTDNRMRASPANKIGFIQSTIEDGDNKTPPGHRQPEMKLDCHQRTNLPMWCTATFPLLSPVVAALSPAGTKHYVGFMEFI